MKQKMSLKIGVSALLVALVSSSAMAGMSCESMKESNVSKQHDKNGSKGKKECMRMDKNTSMHQCEMSKKDKK